ncbi:MAG: SurA N-terminal domain-containing protein [Tannerella sp.]|jgi:peptidyl-prolyl cis-trans isomerase D|nr:SurA N-terminal domain-containing protein [Tannerella sp.]
MATLERIRNKAGLLVTIVGLALFAFIIGDLLNSSSSILNSNQNNVVVVNGEATGYQEYLNLENELTEVYKLQSGQSNLPEAYLSQIRQTVYDEIVMEKLINPHLEDLGITVTPEEMLDMIEGENISPVIAQIPFFQNQQTGTFDRTSVLNFLNAIKNIEQHPESSQAQLRQYKLLWLFWEKNIKRNRLNEKYTGLLSKAIVANSLEAREAFNNASESSDIAYIVQSLPIVPDSTLIIPESDIKKLYEERKEMFRQSETSVIDYIAVDIVPSKEDFDKVAREMGEIRTELETTDNVPALVNEKSERKYVNAFFSITGFETDREVIDFVQTAQVGDIIGPLFADDTYRLLKLVDKTEASDSVQVSELMLAPRATEAATRLYADSLLAVLKGGADFTEIVKAHSVDQMAEKNGELGWMTEASALQSLNEEFKSTVFSLPAGQSATVKTNYGLHIVKVTDRTKSVPKYKVADITYTVTPSSITRSLIYNALNQFVAKNNSIELIEANARDNGYDISTNVKVVSTDQTVGSVTGARQVVRWAFNAKKGQIADEVFECDNKFVVAAHKGKLPEGYQSLAAVTPQLKTELASRKKGEEIAASLKAKNLTSLAAYATELNENVDSVKYINFSTSRITNIGVEPKLNALIVSSPLNKVSEPVAGSNGVYVFEVVNRTKESVEYNEKREKEMLESNSNYRIASLALRQMQRNAEIKDNRIRFQ